MALKLPHQPTHDPFDGSVNPGTGPFQIHPLHQGDQLVHRRQTLVRKAGFSIMINTGPTASTPSSAADRGDRRWAQHQHNRADEEDRSVDKAHPPGERERRPGLHCSTVAPVAWTCPSSPTAAVKDGW